MTNISNEAANPTWEPGAIQSIRLPRRSAAITGLFLLALPLFGQFTGQNVTAAGTNSVLSSTASGKSAGHNTSYHAILYDSSLNQTTDLNPLGYASSVAKATDGVEEAGYTRVGSYDQCTIWQGSASSALMITPPTYLASWCVGTDGGKEIGWAFQASYIYSSEHAILWSGKATGAVDLHGGGTYSRGRGIHGNEQVGETDGSPSMNPDDGLISTLSRAVLWHGTAASMVYLHPAGYLGSGAVATNGVQEGGWAMPSYGTTHAIMWSGSAASAVDLHPAGYSDTRVTAMSDTMQVGDGWVGGAAHAVNAHRHALAWTGSAASVIDLNVFVPVGYTDAVATGIDAAGNVVGYAFMTPTAGNYMPVDAVAVVFAPTPPPPAPISSLTITPSLAHPGDTLTGLVTLSNPATAGGATVSFISGNPALVPAPADVQILEGLSTASFLVPINTASIMAATPVNFLAATGSVRRMTTITVVPVVQLSALSVNPVQGGNQTSGTVTLNIPALAPTTVALSTDNPALTIPASVSFAPGQISQSFQATAAIVSSTTTGTVTASFNGSTVSTTATVSQSVPIVVSSITIPAVVTGQTFRGTVVLNHPAYVGGATISLISSDPILGPVPATLSVPYGSSTVVFTGIAGSVGSQGTATITASLNGSSMSGLLTVNSGPGATIQSLDFWSVSHLIKVTATTALPSGTLTFGVSPNGPPLGILTVEASTGLYQGSASMSKAPATIWVWNSAGGSTVSSSAIRTRSR